MKFEISKDVINQTTKCENNFACLSDDKVICKIQFTVNDKDISIRYSYETDCNYVSYLGRLITCQCPTRIGIYRKYKV